MLLFVQTPPFHAGLHVSTFVQDQFLTRNTNLNFILKKILIRYFLRRFPLLLVEDELLLFVQIPLFHAGLHVSGFV